MFKQVVGIHGVPRSGTTWLTQIFNSVDQIKIAYQPLFSYEFKDYLSLNSTSRDLQDFFEKIWISEDPFISMKDKKLHQNHPDFRKSSCPTILAFKHVRYHHLLPKWMEEDANLKLVLIIRNPLAVISSWYNAPREFDKEWSIMEEWREARKKNHNKPEEFYGFLKWKEASNIFLDLKEKHPQRVELITYDDLLENTFLTIKKVFQLIQINELPEQTQLFLKESRSKTDSDPYSVFKEKTKDMLWKKFIPESIKSIVIDDLEGTTLSRFLTNL